MVTVAVIARRDFSYNGRSITASEVLDVPPVDAVVLCNAGRATLAPIGASPKVVQKPKRKYTRRDQTSETPKRQYRRRDLTPEE